MYRNFLAIVILLCALNGFAQKKDSSSSTSTPLSFSDFWNDRVQIDSGLVTIYTKEGRYYGEINNTLLGKDLLLVTRISKGAADTRGGMMGYAGDEITNGVVRFDKGIGNQIYLKEVSFSERASDSVGQLYKAVSASNILPIVNSFDIKAFSKNKDGYLIDLTDFVRGETPILFFQPVQKTTLKLGAFQNDKSFIASVKSFPYNTEIKTVKTYARVNVEFIPGFIMQREIGSPFITIELNTSFIQLPGSPMRPRFHDPRVGYFNISYADFDKNPQGVAVRSMIKRWRLEPKDGEWEKYMAGELVEPKKPIIFYIDPATPARWVDFLKKGVTDWQVAFEKAGFKNAIYAAEPPTRQQDSAWSLEDARYSAIVYKASTIPNASGPSIADPRSGEILESHINWYHNVMQLLHDWYMIQASPSDLRARKMKYDDALMGQLIRFVSSHEVGHTLGLTHNFLSSATVPVDSLRNKSWVETNGHTPSIMDYARFNYVAQPEDKIGELGIFPRIGDYDKWAIEFGYRVFDFKSEDEEEKYLGKWVTDKIKNKRLQFGSEFNLDDPRCQSEALGDDAMKASLFGIKNLQLIIPNLKEWTASPNTNYSDLRDIYQDVLKQYRTYINHVMTNVAGVYYTPRNTDEVGKSYEVVPKSIQQRAVRFINEQVFETPMWLVHQDIIDYTGLSPVALMESLQNQFLDALLSGSTCYSLVQAAEQTKDDCYTAVELIADLKKCIWKELAKGDKISVYRRNLQKRFIVNLIAMAGFESKPEQSRPIGGGMILVTSEVDMSDKTDISSVARWQLSQLRQEIQRSIPLVHDTMTKLHLQDLEQKITRRFAGR